MILLYGLALIVLIFGFVVFRGAPYVPSHRRYAVNALTKLYDLDEKDVLVDVGSGDGIILRLASAKGARAIGYELNPILVLISRIAARGSRLQSTKLADFWLVDLPVETTVVYAFSVSRDVEKLARKIQKTANAAGHSVWLITYGAPIKSLEAVRTLDAHALYLFEPQPQQTN